MKKDYLECGMVINKRGINGELKLDCYCDSPESVYGAKKLYGDELGKEAYDVVSIKSYKGFLYVKLSQIDSAEKADGIRGKILYVSRNDVAVEEGRYFISDLLGLEVRDCDTNVLYGKITDVQNFGASDLYVVSDGKNEYMVPAVKEIVVSVDTGSCVYVKPISGLFDVAEEIH